MKKIIKCSLMIVLVIMTGRTLHSQVIIRPTWGANAVTSIPEILNLSFENTLPSALNVSIQISIETDKKEALVHGVSNAFYLNMGTSVMGTEVNSLMTYSFATTPTSKILMNTQMFPPGEYRIHYKLISSSDHSVIGEFSTDFSIAVVSPVETVKSTQQKNILIHGTSEVLFNYASTQSNYSLLPPTYLNWTFSPQLTIYDVPVSGRLFLTTMQLPGQQPMNSFNLNFDVNQFRNILKTKLLALMKKNKYTNKIANLNFDSYAKELGNIKEIMSNPQVMDEINKLKELDSLKNIANNYKDGFSDIKEGVGQVKQGVSDVKETYAGIKDAYNENKDRLLLLADSAGIHLPSTDNSKRFDKNSKIDSSVIYVKDSLLHIQQGLNEKGENIYSKTDSLQNIAQEYISDPESLGNQALDSLKSKIKALEWLEPKKAYYDQLLEKKSKIENFGKKLGLIDSSGNFSIDKYKDIDPSKLANPDYLFEKLKSSKLLRKFDKILYSVKKVSIGASNTQYSDFTLNGMTVNGFSVELEPFKIYTSFTYGDVLNPVLTNNTQFGSYRRTLIAGKLGYGRKEETHLHVTMLSATDDSTSVNPRDSLYLYHILPKDNKVISVDGKLVLFKNKLVITAELSGSQTIKDLSDYSNGNNVLLGPNPASENDWVQNIFTQNKNVNKAVVDYAVSAKADGFLFKDKTEISASFKRVGPNYYSFGLPFLIRDMMTFELKVSQKLWKNRIQVAGFIRHNNDNLSDTKLLTTQFYTYGFNVALTIPNYPTFKASLMPIALQNDSSYINMTVFNATTSYSYKIARVQNISSLSFINQSSFANDTNLTFNISYVNLYHNIILKKGPTISINGSYISSTTNNAAKDTWIAGLGSSMTFFKRWNNTIGGNVYVNERELKWGAYFQTSLNFMSHLTFNFRIENNQFNTYVYLPGVNDYTQLICRTSLVAKW